MKKLIYAATFTLVFASTVPAVLAGGILRDAKVPHVVHSNAHPNDARVLATHHFEVHVQGSDLSQISINVPEGIKVNDEIAVADQSGKKIDAAVSVNDRKFTVAFAQPVPSGTTLSVSMKGVRIPFSLQESTLLYPITGKSVGMNAEGGIGTARIQTYL